MAEDVQTVLDRIGSVVAESGRRIEDADDSVRTIRDLTACRRNLERVASSISQDIFSSISTSIDELITIAQQRDNDQLNSNQPALPTTRPQVPGRGEFNIYFRLL